MKREKFFTTLNPETKFKLRLLSAKNNMAMNEFLEKIILDAEIKEFGSKIEMFKKEA